VTRKGKKRMLIVACQICGEFRIIPGTPDSDGIARARWTCRKCGTGQVIQLPVTVDARGGDLGKILGGMGFSVPVDAVNPGPGDTEA
jgi:hypothetical protein